MNVTRTVMQLMSRQSSTVFRNVSMLIL